MIVGKDLVAASAAPLVLGILDEGDNYGYAIIQRVAELSDDQLEWSEGLLYPLLHRLERQGHVQSFWGQGPTGRRRKYYRITPDGKDQLRSQRRAWQTVENTLAKLWREVADEIGAWGGFDWKGSWA